MSDSSVCPCGSLVENGRHYYIETEKTFIQRARRVIPNPNPAVLLEQSKHYVGRRIYGTVCTAPDNPVWR